MSYECAELNPQLEAAMALVRKAANSPALDISGGRGLVDIAARYAQTFLLLQRYDEGLLSEPQAQPGGRLPSLEEVRAALKSLKTELIGRGEPAYPSVSVIPYFTCGAA